MGGDNAGDIDDPPPSAFPHACNDGLRQLDRRQIVDLHQPAEVIGGELVDRTVHGDTSVIDQDVHRPEPPLDFRDDCRHRTRIREIGDQRDPPATRLLDLLNGPFEGIDFRRSVGLQRAGDNRDSCPFSGQADGNTRTNATAGPGHHNHPSVERMHYPEPCHMRASRPRDGRPSARRCHRQETRTRMTWTRGSSSGPRSTFSTLGSDAASSLRRPR